jgi:hypothetical protein
MCPTAPLESSASHVLKYAARYTHRVAVSNDRVLDIEDEKVHWIMPGLPQHWD